MVASLLFDRYQNHPFFGEWIPDEGSQDQRDLFESLLYNSFHLFEVWGLEEPSKGNLFAVCLFEKAHTRHQSEDLFFLKKAR